MGYRMEIIKLQNEFKGKGDMKGFTFVKEYENDKAYIYKVFNEWGNTKWEIFKKKLKYKYDFKTKVKDTNVLKEYYPSSESFGEWAYCCHSYDRAIEKMGLKGWV